MLIQRFQTIYNNLVMSYRIPHISHETLCVSLNWTCERESFVLNCYASLMNRVILPYMYAFYDSTNEESISIYLSALRISEGRYFINGNRRLSRDGKYTAAGSVFRYHSRYSTKCPGECILSEGPTTEPVDIMVVSQQSEQNPCFL